MYILGLSSYAHEAACSLIKDGRIVSVFEQERLNREKHTWKYPAAAIEECLKIAGISIRDIDHITFFWRPLDEIPRNLWHILRYFPQSLNLFKTPAVMSQLTFYQRIGAMAAIGTQIKKQFGLSFTPQVHFIEHHLCHAASCFFVSPFKEAAILTMDGRGESTSTLLSAGKDNKIIKLKEINVPHSVGFLYAAVTDYLGFRTHSDEWKVMGMSAYGKDTFVKDFADLVDLDNDYYRLNLKYFQFHTHGQMQWVSDYFIRKFGPKRKFNDPYQQQHYDIAYALQRLTETIGVKLANKLYQMTNLPYLCMTGGVVLNCLMNKRIVEETPYKDFFFQPIANDAGTTLGSALYLYHHILGNKRTTVFNSVYLGNEFTNEEIENVLKQKKVQYRMSKAIAKETAQYIAQNKIVGWFQGRMEAGPRALGNRSITVNPTDPDMKEKLNARVKRREMFRPFAPSVLEERVADYFIMPKGLMSPYMILVGEVRDDKRHLIPAVTHADGTARVHTVNQSVNPKYWELIHEFGKMTGVYVLLNTSFNENEPIVCTPEEAVDCFLRTAFDVLSIGDFIVTK